MAEALALATATATNRETFPPMTTALADQIKEKDKQSKSLKSQLANATQLKSNTNEETITEDPGGPMVI
jgi:hypothetical protein